jgi:2-polyprenyl-3-methyl-5-hydroxy-6-metoxy-1,4-benzoquinol methylase
MNFYFNKRVLTGFTIAVLALLILGGFIPQHTTAYGYVDTPKRMVNIVDKANTPSKLMVELSSSIVEEMRFSCRNFSLNYLLTS